MLVWSGGKHAAADCKMPGEACISSLMNRTMLGMQSAEHTSPHRCQAKDARVAVEHIVLQLLS